MSIKGVLVIAVLVAMVTSLCWYGLIIADQDRDKVIEETECIIELTGEGQWKEYTVTSHIDGILSEKNGQLFFCNGAMHESILLVKGETIHVYTKEGGEFQWEKN